MKKKEKKNISLLTSKEKIVFFLLIFNILSFQMLHFWIEDSSHYCEERARHVEENVWIYLAMFGDLTIFADVFLYEQAYC